MHKEDTMARSRGGHVHMEREREREIFKREKKI